MSRLREAIERSRRESDSVPSVADLVSSSLPSERHQASSPWDFSGASPAPAARERGAEPLVEALRRPDWATEPQGLTDTEFEAPRPWYRLARVWLVLLAVLAAGAALWYLSGRPAGGTAGGADLFTVRQGDLRRLVAGRGRIEPYAEYRVSANVLGRVKTIYAAEGQQVARGDLLAEMDAEEFSAAVAQARARLAEARARHAEVMAGPRPEELAAARARVQEAEAVLDESTQALHRGRRLLAEGTISRAQFDEIERQQSVAAARYAAAVEELNLVAAGPRTELRDAVRAQVSQAEADLQRAMVTLSYAKILAPVDGTVLRRFMEPGEVVVLQRPQPILTLADMSRVRVTAEIDETDIPFVRPSQKVIVTSDAYPGREFEGVVSSIGWEVGRKRIQSDDPAEMLDTKVVETEIALSPADVRWTAGASVDVEIVALEEKNVLIVPVAAVEDRDGEHWVRVQRGQSSAPTRVTLGGHDQQFREVRAGLSAGDVVLVPR
jgi:ABC exporter DevB family membrane fusion protein